MAKQCKKETCSYPVFGGLYCKNHQYLREDKKEKNKTSPVIKTTGEYQLFLSIYAERKGICEITGKSLKFDVGCFAHILSKGAYPSYRLNPDNIIMMDKEIHDLYDNRSKEKLLDKFPEAQIIYDKKDKLRYLYYNS